LRNEFRSTQEIARQNTQVSFYMYTSTWSGSCIRTFKMCIASAILVRGSVICFHFIFCSYYVFVYLTCVRCLYIFLVHAEKIGKQEPGTPFSKLLDSHLMQQWFMGYFHKKIFRIPLIVSYIELFILWFFCAPSEWCSNNQNYVINLRIVIKICSSQLLIFHR
jgi:hypothetical protein